MRMNEDGTVNHSYFEVSYVKSLDSFRVDYGIYYRLLNADELISLRK